MVGIRKQGLKQLFRGWWFFLKKMFEKDFIRQIFVCYIYLATNKRVWFTLAYFLTTFKWISVHILKQVKYVRTNYDVGFNFYALTMLLCHAFFQFSFCLMHHSTLVSLPSHFHKLLGHLLLFLHSWFSFCGLVPFKVSFSSKQPLTQSYSR